MNRWPLRLQLLLEGSQRWALLLGVSMAGVVLAWGWLLPSAQQQLLQQKDALRSLSRGGAAQPAPPAPPAPPAIMPMPTPLQTFEATLADEAALAKLMRRIWQQAPEAGVILSKIDYQFETDSAGQFLRTTLKVPMHGSYPAVRRFAFSLLADFPALSLDKLTIKREPGGGAQIEASAYLTLYQRT